MDGFGVLFAGEMIARVQDRIPASDTDPPREAKQNPTNYLARNIQFSRIEIVFHSRTMDRSPRCDRRYIS
jgi:hypothetical protein